MASMSERLEKAFVQDAIMGLNSVFRSGTHDGSRLIAVIHQDTGWVQHMYKIGKIQLTDGAKKALAYSLTEEKRYREFNRRMYGGLPSAQFYR